MSTSQVPAFDLSRCTQPKKTTTEETSSPALKPAEAANDPANASTQPATVAPSETPQISSPAIQEKAENNRLPERVVFVSEFDRHPTLDTRKYPNPPEGDSKIPPTTASNVAYILREHNVSIRYNVIKKQIEASWPGQYGVTENLSSTSLNVLVSLLVKNKMSATSVPSMLEIVANLNPYNPAADWINSKPWDGVDRLEAFCQTLTERPDFSVSLKKTLIHRWLISAAAAALMESGFHSRGILTLQGPQSIGKTSWIRGLINEPVLQKPLIRIDHHLDASSKDSKLTAISHWMVEIGELDSSLKKDVARLKGFVTSDQDKIRRPYARGDAEYPRRTVFCASVNDHAFLVDQTGNSRFWTIPVTQIDYQHNIDMQQLFAQMAVDFHNGVEWWLTRDEEARLEQHNKEHRIVSVIRERLLAAINTDPLPTQKETKSYSATQALAHIGFERPSNPQCKEAAAVLRELLGDSKKIQGTQKWRIPFRNFNGFTADLNQPTPDPDDLY